MTYNVFGGTFNLAEPQPLDCISWSIISVFALSCCELSLPQSSHRCHHVASCQLSLWQSSHRRIMWLPVSWVYHSYVCGFLSV